MKYPSDNILREALKEINEPVVFQKILHDAKGEYACKLFEWDILQLSERFGDTKLPFRVGYNDGSMGPQWDVNCSTISLTLSELLECIKLPENNNKWYYFDYKYMHEWFRNKLEIINAVNWKRFGIDKDGTDSTLWIGSKGAHTNCHQDSYGCNLVAQIHGRKEWLLFPPNSTNSLKPTRIPYEESTVYSKYNFFCPTKEEQTKILSSQDMPQLIILEPGDVLFVPPGWWHYVESLDLSVSVNIWLPILADNISRVKEAIVKLLVARIDRNFCNTSDVGHCKLSFCMNLLDIALEQCKKGETTEIPCKKVKHGKWCSKDLAMEYPLSVKLLHELNANEFEEFLKMKRERFSHDCIDILKANTSKEDIEKQHICSSAESLPEKLVNALCHPDVINKVTELLLL